jgi:hypothetical protein
MRTKVISEQVLSVLSRVTIDGNKIYLPEQLDRKDYVAVNKILMHIGGKWDKKTKAHLYNEDPTVALEQVLLIGKIIPLKNFGYFPTPPELAMNMINHANLKHGMVILEPSAGQGGIADHIRKDCHINCIELLADNVKVLNDKGYNTTQCDFLQHGILSYDRVIMNPPFSPKQADIDHVLHAWKFLVPGGRLVAIMSAGVMFRENKKTVDFRKFVTDHFGLMKYNDPGSFKLSGTMVNTIMLIIDKPE